MSRDICPRCPATSHWSGRGDLNPRLHLRKASDLPEARDRFTQAAVGVREPAGIALRAPVHLCEACQSRHHFPRSYKSDAMVEMVTRGDKGILETHQRR